MSINWKFPYHSNEWKTLRLKHLKNEYMCVKCEKTINLQVDHIIEHNNNINLFLNPDNLQTLCLWCHSKKTLMFQKLLKLKNIKDFKIVLKFNELKSELITDNFFFNKNKFNEFERINGNFYFSFKDSELTFKKFLLVADLLSKFFINQKFITFEITTKNLNNPELWNFKNYFEVKLNKIKKENQQCIN